MAFKEAFKRLERKIKDIVLINQDYLMRQCDTAPAKFVGNAGFRQPAPGAMPPVNLPSLGDDVARGRSKFNIRYFDRDNRRAPDTVYTLSNDVKLIAAAEEGTFGESGVLATTGLGGLPTHMPSSTWQRNVEVIAQNSAANGLPPVAGAPHIFKPNGWSGRPDDTGFA